MLYALYEAQRSALAGISALASGTVSLLSNPLNPWYHTQAGTIASSALDVFAHAAQPYGKPDFGVHETEIDGITVAIKEQIVTRAPFGQLKRFVRQETKGVSLTNHPKLLVVAPMSGHFASLLRGTVAQMVPDHDVYLTDWRDAKNVALSDGHFDLNDYIDYIIGYLAEMGPGAHVLAVCQPSVPVYAAVALMNASKHPCAPASLTMMGGPVDTRENPTAVNALAMQRPFAWFEQNVIVKVPQYYRGGGRKVYPGFLQLSGFMSMNLGNHMMSHWNMFKHLVQGDGESADATKAFYDEYRSVCDMTSEFYLQTIDEVFQRHLLPKGEFMHRGTRVDFSKITKTAILAVEGERDDISGIGQTKAALTMASKLAESKKQYYLAKTVGHYGIFNGRKWREVISPVVKKFIASHK
jgi:poly(3-hydroxybutyrate) depolymerase